MPGASKLTIENVIRNAEKTERGIWKHLNIPLPAWGTTAGVPLAAIGAGAVGYAASVAASPNCLQSIRFAAAATTTDIIQTALAVPPDFRAQVSASTPKLVLFMRCRLLDTTGSATANADFAFTAQAFWHKTADTALSTLATAVTTIIGATDYVATDEAGFVLYKWDIGAAMTAAQLALLGPLDTLNIQIAPDQAVGTALAAEIVNTFLMYEGHASIPASVLSTLSL